MVQNIIKSIYAKLTGCSKRFEQKILIKLQHVFKSLEFDVLLVSSSLHNSQSEVAEFND